MRTKLAAASARATETEGFLFFCGGRRLACISLSTAAGTAATTVRSSFNRLAPTRRHSPEKDSRRLYRATSRSAEKRLDAGWAGRRFHAGRVGPRQNARLSADHARTNYSPR